MNEWIAERSLRLREFFDLSTDAALFAPEATQFAEGADGLKHFHIEWHVIPAADAVPLDDRYFARLYPHAARDFAGNATCYAVGSSSPADFSYIAEVEGEGEWSLLGFRVAIVPE